MRKTFTVLLCVALCMFTFVACSNEKDETVAVSFNILDNSRDTGLTVSTSGGIYTGDIADLTWIYTATPIGTTYFTVGKTTDYATITMTKNGSSFTSGDITLSKGKWSFTLLGIDTSTASDTSNDNNKEYAIDGDSPIKGTLVYQGKVDEVLVSERTSIQIELSNIIEGTDAYLIFQSLAIQPLAVQATYTLVPNRITIDNTVYQYSDSESGEKIIQSGDKITVKAGEHKVIISYVTKYDDGSEVINASATKIVTPATGQEVTIEGTILEDTVTANFNGIITDGSLGNVYDLDENKYYWLVEDTTTGELVFKETNDADAATVEPTVNDNLELLDCSLSNDIPDEYITDTFETMNFGDKFKKNTLAYNYNGYTWTVYHPAVCTHTDYATLNTSLSSSGYVGGFKAGYGTKLEPYEIDSLDYWYDAYLNRKDSSSNYIYAYYKWTGDSKIDLSKYYYYSYLCGSFDFNGATITNPNYYVFNNLYTVDNKLCEIKNLKLTYNGYGSPLFNCFYAPTIFKNIEVSGTLFRQLVIGTFSNYLDSSGTNSASSVTFENCASDAELIALPHLSSTNTTTYRLGGFIGYTGGTTTININNSSYTGKMYMTTDSSASTVTYNYVIATPSSTSNTVTVYEDNVLKVNGNWQIDTSKQKTYAYENISTLDTTEKVEVVAADNATKADFYYWVEVNVSGSPKTTSGVSLDKYVATLIRVKGVEKTGSNFTTDKVKDMSIVADEGSTYQLTYDEDNFKLTVGGTKLSYVNRNIYVIQRNSEGEIVKISRKYKYESNS